MDLLSYSLSVYFLYHLVSNSDILATPRRWAHRVLPGWVMYPTQCAFCWTFWVGAALTLATRATTGRWIIDISVLTCAPVICYLINLLAQRLSPPTS